jgi:hypothetical protein
MTKFDESKLKGRRALSQEDIRDRDHWDMSDDSSDEGERRHSYPMSPKTQDKVYDPHFAQIVENISMRKEKKVRNSKNEIMCI